MAQWFWRRRFFNFDMVFSLLYYHIPLEKGRALHLDKLESLSAKDALCQVMLKLALWFLRRTFFNLVNVFLLFPDYLPLGKGRAIHLNKLEPPSPKDALCQVWLKFAQWFWKGRWKFTVRRTTTFVWQLKHSTSEGPNPVC